MKNKNKWTLYLPVCLPVSVYPHLSRSSSNNSFSSLGADTIPNSPFHPAERVAAKHWFNVVKFRLELNFLSFKKYFNYWKTLLNKNMGLSFLSAYKATRDFFKPWYIILLLVRTSETRAASGLRASPAELPRNTCNVLRTDAVSPHACMCMHAHSHRAGQPKRTTELYLNAHLLFVNASHAIVHRLRCTWKDQRPIYLGKI